MDNTTKLWDYLRSNGINTEQELDKVIASMDKLDVGCMTHSPKGGESVGENHNYSLATANG